MKLKIFTSIKFYQLLDFLTLIILLVSVVSSILTFINFILGKTPPVIIILVSGFLGTSLVLIFILVKLQSVNLGRFITYSKELHEMSRLIRDEYHFLQVKREVREEILIEGVTTTSQKCVNYISHILKQSTGQEVSVCIKIFPITNKKGNSNNRLEESPVKTLCRSDNAAPEREITTLNPLECYTALEAIIIERQPHFASPDLNDYNNYARLTGRKLYVDHSEPRWEEYYISLIVVPIRFSEVYDGTRGFTPQIFGFLWADSASKSTFRDDKYLPYYIQLMKAFANQLCFYFDCIYQKMDTLGVPHTQN
jgi:hypothetical protein